MRNTVLVKEREALRTVCVRVCGTYEGHAHLKHAAHERQDLADSLYIL